MRSTNSAVLPVDDMGTEKIAETEVLRECGIYEAPDGRKFVASRFRRKTATGSRISSATGSNSNYFLFTQYHWSFHGEPDFEVGVNGVLLPRRSPATWTVYELVDTGFTAGYH